MLPRFVTRSSALLGLALVAASCRTTSIAYHFTPSPLEVLVQQSASSPIVARVLIGVLGAEREGRRSDGHPMLLARVRVENKSEEPVTFDPASAVLVGSDLAQFGPAVPDPDGVTSVPAGEARAVLLRFKFPLDGSLEAPLLTGVNLQFELGHPSGDVELSATLERYQVELVDDTGPYWSFGPGFYYCW